jgi:hypothetical protein
MARVEDAYECNRSVQLWPKALALLRDPTDRYLPTLHALKPELKTESEVAAISEMNLLPVSCSFKCQQYQA